MSESNGTIHIKRTILRSGIEIEIGRKNYFLSYPASIWQQFPEVYRQTFADSITYFLTAHLTFLNNHRLIYHFPPPPTEPFFFKGMVYSLPETMITDDHAITMSELLQMFYNTQFRIDFLGRPRYARFKNVVRNSKKQAVIPFTFGKDSLTTFALAQELGINPCLIFFREPHSPYENKHKARLAQRFMDEFDVDVNFFPVTAGWLRQTKDRYWGWDLLLTQYTLLLIPYLFGTRSKYLFWSHEQSCNELFTDKQGYVVSPVYEQTYRWLISTNVMAKTIGCNAIFSSLIEPLHDMAIMKILHYRYPDIAKYQLSCFADEEPSKTHRWCGICSKCARIYIFLLALGIPPKRVGFTQNMMVREKRHLFSIFANRKKVLASAYDQSGVGRDELLLAFTMAANKGVKGELMSEFKKTYGREGRAREKQLRGIFFSTHSTYSYSAELKKPLMSIFEEELKEMR